VFKIVRLTCAGTVGVKEGFKPRIDKSLKVVEKGEAEEVDGVLPI
jgi:hypothetical protein